MIVISFSIAHFTIDTYLRSNMTGTAVSTMITANSNAFDNDFERHIVESSQTGKNISIHRPN